MGGSGGDAEGRGYCLAWKCSAQKWSRDKLCVSFIGFNFCYFADFEFSACKTIKMKYDVYECCGRHKHTVSDDGPHLKLKIEVLNGNKVSINIQCYVPAPRVKTQTRFSHVGFLKGK